MTDVTPLTAEECPHIDVTTFGSAETGPLLWACDECKRRFYPACQVCVDVGHRNIEHPEATARSKTRCDFDCERCRLARLTDGSIAAVIEAEAAATEQEGLDLDRRLIDTTPRIGELIETIELEIDMHNPVGWNYECDCGDQIAGETFNRHVSKMVDYRLTATDGDA